MSILNGIIKRWNKNTEIYDTIHPETEHAQVIDFGQGTIVHLLATTLASTVEAVSTDSLFGKLVSKLLDASGVQYNFSNSNAWYICFGSLLGGLIIQGGILEVANGKTTTLPITLTMNGTALATHLQGDPPDSEYAASIWISDDMAQIKTYFHAVAGYQLAWIYWLVIGK